MLSRANNGQWNGGRVPYGYSYDKETRSFSLNAEENAVYNRICDLYENNQSVLYVTRFLNEQGIRTRSGGLWNTTGVHKILTNIWYKGAYRYNVHDESNGFTRKDKGEWVVVENHHIPSIDATRFDRIQAMLARNRRGGVPQGKTYVRKNVHIFSGLVRCGLCGNNMSATVDRRRVNGWRPSIYGCSTHRNNITECQNKYISDITLGPFVFNFSANILRAKGRIGPRTSLPQLQKLLLRGKIFENVKGIDEDSLLRLKELLLDGETGLEYSPSSILVGKGAQTTSELEALRERKRRNEAALARLKALYLYSEDSMAEKDYIVENQRITTDLEAIEHRMGELAAQGADTLESNTQTAEKASYFLMIEKMMQDGYINYADTIRRLDPSVPRAFVRATIREIVVAGGVVKSILFKNGIRCTFS